MIVDLSHYPCSVIIIGVGDANFQMMHELDGDDGVLRDDNLRACLHDIVQFVEFNKSLKHGHLAEDVLKEIPRQLCDYMEAVNYVPHPVS
jgi:hypothetical protein